MIASKRHKLSVWFLVIVWVLITIAIIGWRWDSFINWRIQRVTKNFPNLCFNDSMVMFKKVDGLSKLLLRERTRYMVQELNLSRRYYTEMVASKTNEAFITYVHLKWIIVERLQCDNAPVELLAPKMRNFGETNAFVYAERIIPVGTKGQVGF